MFMKNKTVRGVLYSVLGVTCLYTGISCMATLHKANTQLYLMSGTIRFDFMGYYMMAVINGAVCAVSVFALTFFWIRVKKQKSKYIKNKCKK